MTLAPTPYNLNNPHEVFRLYRELWGYMRVSLEDGTDHTGRRFAFEALGELIKRDKIAGAKLAMHLISGVKLTGPAEYEAKVVDEVERVLVEKGFEVRREVKIGPRSRIDLYLPLYQVGIEIKKGKPNTTDVSDQLRRYAESTKIDALILVSERGLHTHLTDANGKPILYVSLAANWGLTV